MPRQPLERTTPKVQTHQSTIVQDVCSPHTFTVSWRLHTNETKGPIGHPIGRASHTHGVSVHRKDMSHLVKTQSSTTFSGQCSPPLHSCRRTARWSHSRCPIPPISCRMNRRVAYHALLCLLLLKISVTFTLDMRFLPDELPKLLEDFSLVGDML